MSDKVVETSVWGPNPNTERGVHTQIYLTKDGKLLSYGCDRNAVVRSTEALGDFTCYQKHVEKVTAVQVSPSGGWVASGDALGKAIVWGLKKRDDGEHSVKLEIPVFAGKVFDICWGPENKRVAAVGAGKAAKGKCFMWDSGNSLGEMDNHIKPALSVSIKPNRPYRLVTGAEDYYQNFYKGPPFKWLHTKKPHTNYINCVRYSPDGSRYVSASSDKRCIFWDGKEGTELGELDPASKHKGGLYAVAWSPDGKRVATASGDKTVKIWDSESYALIKTCIVSDSPSVEDMQVGLDWKADKLVSCSLSGDLNFFNPDDDSEKPVNVVVGHQTNVLGMGISKTDGITYSIAGGNDKGEIIAWDPAGVATRVGRQSSRSLVLAVAGTFAVAGSLDSMCTVASLETGIKTTFPLEGGEPKCAAGSPSGVSIIGTTEGLNLIDADHNKTHFLAKEKPSAIAINEEGTIAAVGTKGKPYVVHILKIEGGKLVPDGVLGNFSYPVSAIAFSHKGEYIAVADSSREVSLWIAESREAKVQHMWQMHTSTVTQLEFSPDDAWLVSGGVDSMIMLWDTSKKTKYIKGRSQHVSGGISAITWRDAGTVMTSGRDGCIKQFAVTLA